MYWFVPVYYYPELPQVHQAIQPPTETQETPIIRVEEIERDRRYEWNPNTTFQGLFRKCLAKRQERKPKKVWTEEQDQILLSYRQEGRSWEEISMRVLNGSQIKCKRRYQRLIKQAQKWPSEINQALKRLYQENGLGWVQIREYIAENFSRSYSLKSIRERYINSLRDGIDKNPWTFDEDLRLLGILCEYGREWQKVSSFFPSRSERHIKNRFSCTLEPVLKKICKRKCFKDLGAEMQKLVRPY